MRETKDQKISRLERQKAELGDLVKELKKKVRGTGKDSKEEVANLKRTIRELKSKHKEEIEKLTSERDNLLLEVEKLKKDLELARYLRKQAESKSSKSTDSWVDESPKETKKEILSNKYLTIKERLAIEEFERQCKEGDEKDLEYFNYGLNRDPYNQPFFDLKDLLIKINPKTGRHLTPFQREMLLSSLRNDETYKRYKRSSEQITDNEVLLEHCRNLYNILYKDFDFDSL